MNKPNIYNKSEGHVHKEAFCHMIYEGNTSRKRISIWNSRNGVTPFVVYIDGEEYSHVDWDADTPDPNYKPKVGDYIFRDVRRNDLVPKLEKRIEEMKEAIENDPDQFSYLKSILDNPEEYIENTVQEALRNHSPTLEHIE